MDTLCTIPNIHASIQETISVSDVQETIGYTHVHGAISVNIKVAILFGLEIFFP